MTACLFPNNAPSTGYRKGCKCERCAGDHAARGHAWHEANRERNNERSRARHEANREDHNAKSRLYYAANRVVQNARARDYHRLTRYGVSPERFAALMEAQGGTCRRCGAAPGARSLHIDHDHRCCPGSSSCGRCVRGLLCASCNALVAVFEGGRRLSEAERVWLASYCDSVLPQ